ncbi:MAG: NADH-quinone oxidoreductase subunit NuoK [Bacteroidetes bacterium]|nr:NADH-quinone oxidoreductase subunit NuoK [Bacteroidota bacterium]
MEFITTEYYLLLSGILFTIGIIGVLTRKNAIIIFMSIELMLNAVNLSLISFASSMNDAAGQVLVFFVMAVAAAEASVGLAIILAVFRKKGTISIDNINMLKK